MKLAGWGQYPIFDATVVAPRSLEAVIKRIQLGNAIHVVMVAPMAIVPLA